MRMMKTASKPVRDQDVQVTAAGDGAHVIHLSGAWDIRALESRGRTLQSALRDAALSAGARWDLSQIERFDHIGAMLVWRGWGRCPPPPPPTTSADQIIFSARATRPAPPSPPPRPPPATPLR